MNYLKLYESFFDNLLKGNRRKCSEIILNSLENGYDIRRIYIDIFQKSLLNIGLLWQENKINIAREHLCTAIVQSVIMLVYPYLQVKEDNGKKVVLCGVGKELHEVGSRMIADFFEMEGFDVTYLGTNVPDTDLIDTVKEIKPDIIGISCTMSIHIERVRSLIEKIKKEDISPKVCVGGYAFNQNPELVEYVGGDFTGINAIDTINKANHAIGVLNYAK